MSLQEDFQVQILLHFEIVFIFCPRNSKMKLIFAFALMIVVAAASDCGEADGQEAMALAHAVSIFFILHLFTKMNIVMHIN